VPIRGKLISEITPADILDLILQQTQEDQFLEFKAELLDPRQPRALEASRADWVSDLVAFANANGGHIIVGVGADRQERASGLRPMTGDHAKKLADS
jgi:predicted HTH transcriptional regulator